MKTPIALAGASALVLSLAIAPADLASAQEAEAMEEVVVTGSRIRRNPLNEPVAIMEIGAGDIEDTGLTNLGSALQQLPITGSAINSGFNVPGNSGFPQTASDGSRAHLHPVFRIRLT
jgi:iron complex outermembrane receptor protein